MVPSGQGLANGPAGNPDFIQRGEWAPALNARVDLTKYHTGAALLRNFFVDYRGGATARPGTRYVIQTHNNNTVRLIPFQASFTVTYILEFGDGYIRFINNGVPVLQAPLTITGATQANPCVVSVANTLSVSNWVFISGVSGMTQLNGNYYKVSARTAGTITLQDLYGVNLDATAFGAWTSGGTVQWVYIIASPYLAAELAQIKFVQNVGSLILTHPNHAPQQLTLVSATNWTIAPLVFGSTLASPALGLVATYSAGSASWGYVATAVDINGQESAPGPFNTFTNLQDPRTTVGSSTLTIAAVTGAVSYNIYKTNVRIGATVPAGSQFGFVGNVTSLTFFDGYIAPDFSQGPPVVQNPFFGSGVGSVTVTAPGSYAGGITIPSVSFSGGGGSGAVAYATMKEISIALVSGGSGYNVGDIVNLVDNRASLTIRVLSVDTRGTILTATVVNAGSLVSSPIPTNPATVTGGSFGGAATFNVTWGVASVVVVTPGAGYGSAPAVAFSSGTATATATLGAPTAGNPTVPGIFEERLVLAGPLGSPQQFNFSQPGTYNNFNTTDPVQPDDAIQGTLSSGLLNTIKSLVPQPQGLIALSDKQAWLINGGSAGQPVSATGIVAHAQAYNGAADLPPIVATNDILYVQAKGSIVRDLVFNFYTQIYTGADVSVLSSHLFYGFQLLEWAWAEEPFKVVWAVRNDGQMLTLTFLKEQELIAWSHSDTQGSFASVATITETVPLGSVDAVYTVVKRTINGVQVQYIERFTELYYPHGVTDAWCVDSGIQYNGPATLTFTGAQPLSGVSVTGLATDDTGIVSVITPFTMGTTQTGTFTLSAPPAPATGYTRVTLGLAYLPQLQTLALDLGEPTVQSKRKNIPAVTLRCKDTLGLSAGRSFSATSQKPLKDLVVGNLNVMTNSLVTDLVTGDARIILDPQYDVPGQYCIQQSNPYPASILGVIPEIVVGDTK